MGGLGGDEEKKMADDGTTSHGFDFCLWIRFLIFWPIHLEILAD
jgi:hypothetical protein